MKQGRRAGLPVRRWWACWLAGLTVVWPSRVVVAAEPTVQVTQCSDFRTWQTKLRFAKVTLAEREEGLRAAQKTYAKARQQIATWKELDPKAQVDRQFDGLSNAAERLAELTEYVVTAQVLVGQLTSTLATLEGECSQTAPAVLRCSTAEDLVLRLGKLVELGTYGSQLTVGLRNFSQDFALPPAWSSLQAEVASLARGMQTHWAMFSAAADAVDAVRKGVQTVAAQCPKAAETSSALPKPPEAAPSAPAPAPAPAQPRPTAPAQPTPVAPATAAALFPRLKALVGQHASGMQPDGGAVAARMANGHVWEIPVEVVPGACYTVVAVSEGAGATPTQPAGPRQLQIQLVASAPPLPPVVMAQGETLAPGVAVLGGTPSCYRNPLPIGGPGKVIVRAGDGFGLVLVQVWRR